MDKELAVVFHTCDRYDETRKTVKSFIAHNKNQLDKLDLFYGDDGSVDKRIHQLMNDHRITCVFQSPHRVGCTVSAGQLLNTVANKTTAPYITYIQNDCVFLKTINLKEIQDIFLQQNIGAIRLWGAYKNKEKTLVASNKHLGKKGIFVSWIQHPQYNHVEVGDIHPGLLPIVLRKELVKPLFRDAVRETDTFKNWIPMNLLVARYKENLFDHIGKRTPNGLFGR
jgi:hypothetical protein